MAQEEKNRADYEISNGSEIKVVLSQSVKEERSEERKEKVFQQEAEVQKRLYEVPVSSENAFSTDS